MATYNDFVIVIVFSGHPDLPKQYFIRKAPEGIITTNLSTYARGFRRESEAKDVINDLQLSKLGESWVERVVPPPLLFPQATDKTHWNKKLERMKPHNARVYVKALTDRREIHKPQPASTWYTKCAWQASKALMSTFNIGENTPPPSFLEFVPPPVISDWWAQQTFDMMYNFASMNACAGAPRPVPLDLFNMRQPVADDFKNPDNTTNQTALTVASVFWQYCSGVHGTAQGFVDGVNQGNYDWDNLKSLFENQAKKLRRLRQGKPQLNV